MAVEGGNGSVTIQTAYYRPSADNQEFPAYIDIEIKVGNHTSIHSLSIEEFDVKGIQKHFPLLRFQKTKDRADFDEALVNELTNGLTNGSIKSGYYFEKQGAINFPDGKIGFLRGSKLLGECDRPYKVAPEISDIKLPGRRNSLRQLVDLLKTSPLQVLLVFSFIILSSVRSLLIKKGIDLQAVLYIVGGQGVGKTTLATRIAGIYKKNGNTIGIVQAGSTHSAVNSIMATLRDQAIVIDDLCLSASHDTARKRIDLVSKLIRQATGSTPITKKSGNTTIELPCEASIIITAEFYLENLSDLTRCIIVPIRENLTLPDALTPEIIGHAVRRYSLWFAENVRTATTLYLTGVCNAIAKVNMDPRIATNYSCLKAAFQSFLYFLEDNKYSREETNYLCSRMNAAIQEALESHQAMIEKIKDSIPVGNLSYCILEGYKHNAFDLTEKVKKLNKHDGIIWKDDLCLRSEALIQFIRHQPGYHDWSSNRITRTLKDINALVLQEENAATVRLSKEKGVPRVYRIRIKILEETAQRF